VPNHLIRLARKVRCLIGSKKWTGQRQNPLTLFPPQLNPTKERLKASGRYSAAIDLQYILYNCSGRPVICDWLDIRVLLLPVICSYSFHRICCMLIGRSLQLPLFQPSTEFRKDSEKWAIIADNVVVLNLAMLYIASSGRIFESSFCGTLNSAASNTDMADKMSRRRVLITSCSDGGMGAALAIAFHEAGLHVYAIARSPSKTAHLASLGIETLTLDVQSESSIAACVSEVSDLDIVVNNASVQYKIPFSNLAIPKAKSYSMSMCGPTLLLYRLFYRCCYSLRYVLFSCGKAVSLYRSRGAWELFQ
jgi:hypothetical protein